MRRILNLATQIASDISTVAAREESLVKQTLSTVDKSKESLVLQELAKLSTEKLRDASDVPIRVSLRALPHRSLQNQRDQGFESHQSSKILRKPPKISLHMATHGFN
jgi:hypothetical protein